MKKNNLSIREMRSILLSRIANPPKSLPGLIALLCIFLGSAPSADQEANWPMFRGSPSLTGVNNAGLLNHQTTLELPGKGFHQPHDLAAPLFRINGRRS
jgi:hypothetical protein